MAPAAGATPLAALPAAAALLLLLLLVGAPPGAAGLGAPSLLGTYPALHPPPPVGAAAAECDVTAPRWGARGDGAADDTAAIQAAIRGCRPPAAGAAPYTVVLPPGRVFLSGALNLSSGLTLRVAGTLRAATAPAAYPLVPALPGYGVSRDSGYPAAHAGLRHQALLSGEGLRQVVVDGAGTGVIDGQGGVPDPALGSSWAQRQRAAALVYGRPRLYEPLFSSDVRVQNVTFTNPAFWAVHPYACDDVYIADVRVVAPRDEGIPNDDGIDPDSCANVLVERAYVDVGDNSVAIKSGIDYAGRAFGRPCYNVVMRDSAFLCETWAVGSEMSGGVFNVTVDNCTFGGGGSDFAGIHLKAKRGRGGSVHALRFRNLRFNLSSSTKQPMPFSASMFYSSDVAPTNATATPQMYDVGFENCSIIPAPLPKKSNVAFGFTGLHEQKMRGFTFRDIRIEHRPGDWAWACTDTEGFEFYGEVDPPPSPECRG